MAHESRPTPAVPPALPPWPIMATAAGMLLAAFALSWLPDTLVLPRVLLIVGGLIVAGSAIWLQPREPRLILAGAALACFSSWCMDPYWDSAILVVTVLTWVGLLAAFLVGMPWLIGQLYIAMNHVSSRPGDPDDAFTHGQAAGRVVAKVLVSLLIVLHFGGVATAILATGSGGSNPAWLAQVAWNKYQNYLHFVYLTNAYKFYSPQPGPAYLLMVRIEYEDASVYEFELPNRGDGAPDPLAQEYTRRLSVARGVVNIDSIGATPNALQRRMQRGVASIPLHPRMPVNNQYELPDEGSQRLLQEYVRHIAHSYPHEGDPSIGIAGIKIYRVTHMMLEPNQMSDPNQSPTDMWTFLPYYQGEFTADGVLKDPDDPLLYWLIPIFQAPPGGINLLQAQEELDNPIVGNDYVIQNFFKIHKNQSMGGKAK